MSSVRVLLIFIATISFIVSHAQELPKCDVQIVRRTELQLDHLTIDSTEKFFLTFGDDCSNNAEFSEYWNEVLFKILDKQPEIYLQCMCELTSKKYWSTILKEIENPINDLINIRGILKHLEEFEILKEKCQRKVLRKTIHSLNKVSK